MNIDYRILLSIFLIMVSGTRIWGQEPFMVPFTLNDGMPSNTVYNIYSDSNGYLWFATNKGIARYNGSSFKTFTTADGIPDNEVFFFREDCDGRLWLATLNGKLCFFKDNVFYSEKNAPWLRIPKECVHINSINIEKDSSITFQFGSGFYFLNIKGTRVKVISLNKVAGMLERNNVFYVPIHIIKNTVNRYTILSVKKNIKVDSLGNCLSWNFHRNNAFFTPVWGPQYTYLSFNDTVYDTKGSSVYTIRNRREQEAFTLLKDSSITMLGRNSGLVINDTISLFKDNNIPSITKDFQGNFWISIYNKGACMLPGDYNQTAIYKDAYQGKVRHAIVINNRLLFITEAGTIYRENDKGRFDIIYKPLKQPLFINPFHRILQNNYAVIFTLEHIMLLANINNRPTVKSFQNTVGNAKEILFDGRNIFLFGPRVISTVEFNSLLKENQITWKEFPSRQSYSGGRISSYTMDERGVVWYTIRDSIFSYGGHKPIFQLSFPPEVLKKIVVRNNYIIAFTDNNLLIIYDKIKRSANTIKISDVWDNMYFIDDTRLLLTTNAKHYLLTLDKSIEKYTLNNIKPLKKIYLPKQADYILTGKDYIYFFKEPDIVRVETNAIIKGDRPPKVVFTALHSKKAAYSISSRIQLSYPESRNLILNFEPLSFSDENILYQYTLSPNSSDDSWQNIGATELNFLVPSYGTYTIKVRAKTISSDYSQPAVLTLVISRPYWATWWFWSLAVLSIAAITWIIIRWRTKRIIAKKQQEFEAEKRYQQAEYKALNALMNPHFIFNSMNNIQGLINEDEKQTANDYLVIFSEMIRQNMHNIDQGSISLYKELALCKNYLELEKLRFKELINFHFDIEEDIDTEDIPVPPLIIQPLIENAIRHGLLPRQSPDSMVTIRVRESVNQLIIEVEDNGIGLTAAARNKSALHQSLGLMNIRKRFEHIRKLQQKNIVFTIKEITKEGSVAGTLAVIEIEL